MKYALWSPWVLCCWLCCGCGSGDGSETSVPSSECKSGETVACVCADGSEASAVCTPAGAPGPCNCGSDNDGCGQPGAELACQCEAGDRGVQTCRAGGELTACRCDAAVTTGGTSTAGGPDAGATVQPPAAGRELIQRCCHGLGSCFDVELIPADQADLLNEGGCTPVGEKACVPDAFADPAGFELQPCRSTAGAEGRCLPNCDDDPLLAVLPRDLCDGQHRCAPCYDPFTGADTGLCALSNDRGPREPAMVFDRCCGGTGSCVPGDLLPAEQAGLLGTDSCAGGALCLPDSLREPAAIDLALCHGTADLEGRCLPTCLPLVAAGGELFARGECTEGDACVPCYDPLTGEATGACDLSAGDAPLETPVTFDRCCEIAGEPGGYCVPAGALPAEAANALPQETCPAGTDVCVPDSLLDDPSAPLPGCTTLLGSDGRCVRECIAPANLAPLLSQRQCVEGDLCVPCVVLGNPTGICEAP